MDEATFNKTLDSTLSQLKAKGASQQEMQSFATSFVNDYKTSQVKVAPVQTQTPTVDQKSAQDYGALFPAKTGENPLVAGAKALGNVIPSAFNLVKGLGTAILNPIDTAKSIGKVAVGSVQKLIPGQQAQEENFNQFASFLKERYGSLENLQRTATNDPFGFGTDILTLVGGGAGALGKTAQLEKAIGTVGKTVTTPVAKATEKAGELVGKTTKYGVSQATGLAPETISNIIKNPEQFTNEALKTTTRQNLGTVVKDAIDTRLDNLSDIGSGYQVIKEAPGQVVVPQGTVESVLKKYGVEVVDGKVKTTAEAKPLTSADKTALEDFINVYGNEPVLSNNAFLNTRSALSQLSKYDAAKTGNLTPIARELRGIYDDLGKSQIQGLAELDARYAPEVEVLNKIKKDYLTSTGEFKDGAINKIANLTGTGKEQILNRLEQIVPGVSQRIKIVKAAEDIEKASGLKVGTYARAGVAAFGASTANIPAILAAIISSPEIAVRLLKAYGYTTKTAEPIIKSLYAMANDVNNFRLPGGFQQYISDYIKNPKLGMSIEDVGLGKAGYSSTPKTTNIKPTISAATKNATIPKSITPSKEMSSESTKLVNKAIKEYGTTNNSESLGFITKDGKGIDSSGKLQGSGSEGRNVDHREIAQSAFPESSKLSGTDALIEFMNKTGVVRVKNAGFDNLNIDIISYPTKEQFSYIQKLFKESNNNAYVDISTPTGGIGKSSEINSFAEFKKMADDYFKPESISPQSSLISEAKKYDNTLEDMNNPRFINQWLTSKYGDKLDIFAWQKDGNIKLSKIVIPKNQRGMGIGTKVMNDLIKYANDTKQTITLTPGPEFGGTVPRLKEFYSKLGFKKNTNQAITDTMIYEPKLKVKR